ncbi:MAG: ABC transporter permease [Chloracidobacterium sp.]|nr:ABC transporter permease [Chloracidobacterium sp.]
MEWFNMFMARLRALFRRESVLLDIEEELRVHVEMETEANIKRGMPPDEARSAALKSFGSLSRNTELGYDIRGGGWLETLWQDLRYGARMLAKKPGFTLISIVMLALVIGANTATFSVVSAVMLRSLPYREPGRLITLSDAKQNGRLYATVPARYLDWRTCNDVFTEVAAIEDAEISNRPRFFMTGGDRPERVRGAMVSTNFFSVLGVEPRIGRSFLPEEEETGRGQVVIISDALWRRRFGADPEVIKKTIDLNDKSYAIIGVMPPDFKWNYPQASDLWAPIIFTPAWRQDRSAIVYKVVARLKPGVTLEQARGSMKNLSAALAREHPKTDSNNEALVIPLRERLFGQTREPLLILTAAVGFVLLLACANLANLLLAQATVRSRELAVRAALGASRFRLLRQMLSESLLLGLVGGAFGLVLAFWGRDLLVGLIPATFPRGDEIWIDGWVLFFTAGLSTITGLIFGIVPAWQASRPDVIESLKAGAASVTLGLRSQRLQGLLVAAEAAMAVILLVGAGLMIRSLWRLTRVELGFNPDRMLAVQFVLPYYKYKDQQPIADTISRILARIKTIPGVELAASSDSIPLIGNDALWSFAIPGHPSSRPSGKWNANVRSVSPDFFRALGIRLIKGRLFTEQDDRTAPRVAIVTESMAAKCFPNEEPMGKYLELSDKAPSVIIGVVNDARYSHPNNPLGPAIYQPFAQAPSNVNNLIVRVTGDPPMFSTPVQQAVWAEVADQPIENVTTVGRIVAESFADTSFYTSVFGEFAFLALTLAAMGVYSVVSYSVTQRTHEIGLRVALGAQRGDVIRLVIWKGLTMTLVGITVGIGAAMALSSVMKSLLFSVSATDPLTYIVIALLLISVALLACWIPARRATKVDPLVALNFE